MNNVRKLRCTASVRASCERAYSLELARGSSHIASTLTPLSLADAVDEVRNAFVAAYGEDDLAAFLELLAERLDKRTAREAATAVRRAAAPERRRAPRLPLTLRDSP
ncbi:hypothetical protein [Burkholderia sp. WAC0059]|uniref:hypothetical protein n=1 Tax=Burkholderia sp. WAC0059 TaxID=2066022 RepID=UPI0015E08FBE|nr:hypothetical protein [Burkholderia sp. WAC0059]